MHQPNNSSVAAEVSYITSLIQNKLQSLPHITEECCIYRVSKRLVNIHPTMYEPQLISIGPFHHGREDLKPMEQFKLKFLFRYLSRLSRQLLSFEVVVKAALEWETKARKCYEDCVISMNSHDFVHMLLVDGCFMVEFLVAIYGEHLQTQTTSRVDPLVSQAMNINLYHDLIMLENQLPFFVIQVNFIKHHREIPPNILSAPNKHIGHLLDFLGFYYPPVTKDINQGNNRSLFLPPSTTELYEAGVILEKAVTTSDYNIMG
ncbi:UPF0481 protein [Cucumis melo var. makuwa]|uniref:UPF0481 protein n=1 Tax=Cucumis melo var. makuwa TaxID=1194695 RepID=A0A5D3DPP4_CUCMM|nr:UPF0481 protein [Cucumis melo var. makuwa]TYK25627.1 UPF0481 protein [Cucumis melo var. makuwa]